MGLIVHDTITVKNGMTLTDAYVSIAQDDIRIVRGAKSPSIINANGDPNFSPPFAAWAFRIETLQRIWINQDLRTTMHDPADISVLYYEITDPNDLNIPVFELLYRHIKKLYKSTTDV